jgi:thiol-disulfide isomerase/thioredoxin
MNRCLITAGLLTCMGLGACEKREASPPTPAGTRVGDHALDIVGDDTSGKPMALSEFRGKVVLLDFWGDW